jgi:hypothetical protein
VDSNIPDLVGGFLTGNPSDTTVGLGQVGAPSVPVIGMQSTGSLTDTGIILGGNNIPSIVNAPSELGNTGLLGVIPAGAIPVAANPAGVLASAAGALPVPVSPEGTIAIPAIPDPAIPVPAIPVPAIPVPAVPVPAIPVPATPLGSIPVPASPVGTIPVPAKPLGTIPVVAPVAKAGVTTPGFLGLLQGLAGGTTLTPAPIVQAAAAPATGLLPIRPLLRRDISSIKDRRKSIGPRRLDTWDDLQKRQDTAGNVLSTLTGAAASLPQVPATPQLPAVPQVPQVPSAPQVPSVPQVAPVSDAPAASSTPAADTQTAAGNGTRSRP